MKFYKFLIFFIFYLQASFLYTAQESSDFAKATTDKKVEDEDDFNEQPNQLIIGCQDATNNSKTTIEDIKEFVSWYPQLDKGFRILQIQNPLFLSFHDFLAFQHFLADFWNIDNNEMPHFDKTIQDAQDLIAIHMKDAFFSRKLRLATKCIYDNTNDDHFNEVFSELSIKDKQDQETSAFDREWFFQIQVICFIMKYRHNFMKNILKSWFDEEFKILHQEYYNLIFKEFRPDDSDDGLEESHFGNMISTNITHDNSCILKFILEIDQNYLQFQDKAGNGLLHYAAQKNAIRCAQLLINQQININSRNNSGATVLFCAVTQCNTEITRILIDAHAHLNFGSESETPLRRAVCNNNIEITRLLINAGANQQLKAPYTFDTLECAATAGYEDIVDILIHAGPTNPPAYNDLRIAELYATTAARKAEIRRIRKQLYPEHETSCCTIS